MIITLKNETMSASIDTLGAQLISLRDASEKEYIWQRDPAFWQNCSPLLFPAVGGSRNGRTIFDGQWYDMPKHGFCKETDFEVKGQTETSATFWMTATETTKKMFPYDFYLSLTYTLTNDGLSMDYLVSNPENRDICYCLGAHPGFIIPLQDGERFEDYQLVFEKEETTSSIIHDASSMQFDVTKRLPLLNHSKVLALTYGLFDNDAIFFNELKSRKVSIVHSETGKGVQVDFPDFETVAFWTPDHKEAPFLCVEPWNGSAICSDEDDEFIHKNHVQILKPQTSKAYHLGIHIL